MRYHNITTDDMLNGDGLRVVLWTAGCEHHCPECQNPITWDRCGGIEFDDEAKKESFDYLSNDYAEGITFSGGDPLATYNRKDILSLAKEIKEKFSEKNIWCYSGYTFEALKEDPVALEIFNYIDVLVDGRYEKDLRDIKLQWRGSSNQRVIDIKKSMAADKVVLYGIEEDVPFQTEIQSCNCDW